jgi:chromosome segregation ATPase
LQESQKASAEQQAAQLSSSLEETKAELSATKCTFAKQEEELRLQLSTATSNAEDLSSRLENKLTLLQKLEDDLRTVVAQKERNLQRALLTFILTRISLFPCFLL